MKSIVDLGRRLPAPLRMLVKRLLPVKLRARLAPVAPGLSRESLDIVVDDRRGHVLEQQVYDATGQLLASAISSQYQFDPVQYVSLPRQIDIQIPPAQLSFTLQVDSYSINQLRADPTQVWAMPQLSDYSYSDLAGGGRR